MLTVETTPVGELSRAIHVERAVEAGDVLVERVALNDATFTNAFVSTYDPSSDMLTLTSPEGRETVLTFDAVVALRRFDGQVGYAA
jgi:hypothetical protein